VLGSNCIRLLLATTIGLAGFVSSAFGQVYKCQSDGKTIFQGTPCGNNSTTKNSSATIVTTVSDMPWSGLEFGMPMRGVEQLFATRKFEKDIKSETLTINSINVSNTRYEAIYHFLNGGFQWFDAFANLKVSSVQAKNIFNSNLAEFRRRYGKEHLIEVLDEPRGFTGGAEWRIKNGRLELGINPGRQENYSMFIIFRPGSEQDQKKIDQLINSIP